MSNVVKKSPIATEASSIKIVINQYGPPHVLEVIEDTPKQPGPNDVRIRVRAAGVGFSDIMAQHGGYPLAPRRPFTPGYDLAGVVEECGSHVTALSVGQNVVALNPDLGCYAGSVTINASYAVPTPQDLDPTMAVALVLNYLTAYAILHRIARVKPGQSILIHSAAGGVGTAVVQLSRLAGLKIFGTASPSKHELLRSYGVTPIDYRSEDFLLRIRQETGAGVDIAVDPFGGSHLLRSYRSIKPGGQVVAHAFSSSKYGGILPMILGVMETGILTILPFGRRVHLCALPHTVKTDQSWYRATMNELLSLYQDGKISPIVCERVPLREAHRAHELVESGSVSGKVVLVPDSRE
jgi:NADPH:quinone reductase-like Zn-dependent oxidoreductase